MKIYNILTYCMLLIMGAGCKHSSEPYYIPQQYTQLNTVIAPWQKDNDLLPWKGQGHMMIINSKEDVYATQTERFIEENPNWLQVDFSTETIIAYRSVLFAFNHWQYTSISSFSRFNFDDEKYDYVKGDYRLCLLEKYSPYTNEDDEDEKQYRIYQIAIVTHKIPADARLHVELGQSVTSSSVWN